MLLPEFIQTRNGMIAAAVVGAGFFLAVTFLADPNKGDHPADDPSALTSGPFELVIVNKEDAGDGVYLLVEITNISDKPVTSANGTMTAKNEFQGRLMSQEHPLITNRDEPLLPGESIPMEYFFFDQHLEEIKFFTFLATFVTYEDIADSQS